MSLSWSKRCVLAILAFVFAGFVSAQSAIPDNARTALQQGQVAAARAMASYEIHFPDQPLWQEAIERGEEARRLAPGRLEPLRFLAQVYTTTQWHFRAWEAWQAYLEAGGQLDVHARRDAVASAVWLGHDRYVAGNLQGAVEFLEAAHGLAPDTPQATGWLGRVYFELGRPEEALPLLRQAVRQMPGFELFGTYLDRAEHQLSYGLAASNAYFEGVRASDGGRHREAVQAFQRAIQSNPNFREAMVAAAESHMALGEPAAAISYWEGALAIEPGDEQAAFFLELAREQVAWGVDAVEAFRQGRSQLQTGNPQAAASALATAVQLNPEYAEAWALRAQVEAALGDDARAETFYARAVELEPQNAAYQTALADVQERIEAAQAPPVAEPEQPATEEPQPVVEAPPPDEPEPVTEEPTPPAESEPVTEEPTPSTEPAPSPESPTAAAVPAQPEQEAPTSSGVFVLFDTTVVHGLDDASSAFHFVQGRVELAPDLTSPVNYASGTLLHRLEVVTKPTERPVQYQLCLVPQDINSRPACTAELGLVFTQPGVYEHSQPLPSLSRYANVDWSAGLSSLMVIVKDAEGNPIDGSYPLREEFEGAPDLSLYYPMEVRYTVVLVPANGEFVGWRAVE